jgi:hypothetical protein
MGWITGLLFLGWSAGIGHSGAAQDGCAFVDLRSKSALRMRNQGDISWCYAHTAADLLQFASGLSAQVSAADIAVQYNKGLWPRFYRWVNGTLVPETGFVRPALSGAHESGYCLESDFPSDLWVRVEPGQDGPNTRKKTLNAAISEILDLQRLVKSGVFKSGAELPFFYEFPGVGREEFFSILMEQPRREVLDGLRQKACEGRRRPYPVEIGSIAMHFRGPGMFRRFHEELESGRPFSLDYFYGMIEDAGRIKKKLADLHTSIVLGQRQDSSSGECQYLIKNSYGENCANLDPRWECEGGYLWVGERAIREAAVSYVLLKTQEK